MDECQAEILCGADFEVLKRQAIERVKFFKVDGWLFVCEKMISSACGEAIMVLVFRKAKVLKTGSGIYC